MKKLLTTTLTSAFLLLGSESAFALTTVLYNGASGTPPNSQGWLYVARNPFVFPQTASSTQTSDASGTTFSSMTNNNIESGYGRTDISLDSNAGYNLRFDLQLLQESRNFSASSNPADKNGDGKDDRAGLSILIVSTDTTKAIELGFFIDRVWAQEDGATEPPRFTQAEGAAFDTRTTVNQYDLSILGNTYYLYTNGNYTTPLLAGRLRDYTTEPDAGGIPNPYKTANTIFIGDNTTAAGGQFRLNQVAITDSGITPVPFAFNPLFGFAVFGLSRLRKAIVKKTEHLND
ncbi:hypothetical protein [Leptolyngbya sp. FACHB-17]|uniref:choice-of-anchor Y domain-containing protein n=1 Tax=unclassified Leptolyngbya TaxID=2650499 RepID=UPI0016804E41|nr:hypothetical protein [Leptolyngbya sp. FACHB-17]MBD2081735.1 hypothetical protein [Leptolyngbya sp. FACHB-17]